jgi:hypothetical protein
VGSSRRRSAQNVCLNFSDCDVAVQLHFALFSESSGYVLKPEGMRLFLDHTSTTSVESDGGSVQSDGPSRWGNFGDKRMPPKVGSAKLLSRIASDGIAAGRELLLDQRDAYWPRARDILSRVTIQFLSLHMLPTVGLEACSRPALVLPSRRTRVFPVDACLARFAWQAGERRPRLSGRRAACHKFHPELSGFAAPPNARKPSTPTVSVSLHPVGGMPLPTPTPHNLAFVLSVSDLRALVTFGFWVGHLCSQGSAR